MRAVATEMPIRAGEAEMRRHVREHAESRNRADVREVVLPSAASCQRHARLSQDEQRRMVEAVRQHVPEELLRVMAAPLTHHLPQGRDVAVGERHFDAIIERLEVCAHRAAAGCAHHAKLRAVEIGTGRHVVDGTHRVPDAETGEVPPHEP